MHRPLLRFLLLASLALTALCADPKPLPPELNRALKRFRAEGAPHWAFIQTTESGGKSLVEHFNPSKPEFSRWTLLRKNGAEPTATELKDYQERLSRRTSGTAPNVKDQIDPASCEQVSSDDIRAAFRFRLQAGDQGDRSAAHMTATFTLHKPTGVIERVELATFEPFSPMLTVKINEAKTTMLYSLPEADHPTLLQKITISVRGRAMWVKSLDEDMTVTYTDHAFVGKKPATDASPTAENPARPSEPAP